MDYTPQALKPCPAAHQDQPINIPSRALSPGATVFAQGHNTMSLTCASQIFENKGQSCYAVQFYYWSDFIFSTTSEIMTISPQVLHELMFRRFIFKCAFLLRDLALKPIIPFSVSTGYTEMFFFYNSFFFLMNFGYNPIMRISGYPQSLGAAQLC